MAGFAHPLRIAASAAPVLLLALNAGAAKAEMLPSPAASYPSASAALAYGSADRVASTLLAGGMSRLAAISAQQGSASLLPWTAPFVEPQAVINEERVKKMLSHMPGWELQGIRLTLAQPVFSYRQPDLIPAFMRGIVATPAASIPTAAILFPTAAPLKRDPVDTPRNGQPDIFGSVAMAVARTPLDGKWAAVAHSAPTAAVPANLLRSARAAQGLQQVELVNSWVNGRLRFVNDRQGGDSWASANQSLLRGAGDCEDYAIAKMQLLAAAGFERRAMFLVIARDLVRRADHAVLAVRIDGQLMVLDNMTDRVLPSSAVSDYRPIMSFNAFGQWTHGYRVKTPQPVQFAAR
ncbi:transglutaminase-like cysteine peptidase [Sphingobium vermicomposti]|uniref:Putative transglutaminase-like cysteine proteinase n=1 Tax=Sphingobium vermicomposti TaxID=529005 RepID=A0A846M6X9_9SPHN|nr:transglutaminase-like cysteine peptidase [Sphingobium vermicomposti]NIJ16928.1 putative transglutaminase-like cysteine proteinase [Sphingobium vermicomposti]